MACSDAVSGVSMSEQKLVVLTNDLPYPPNYGHKVDQYNRWRGFAENGWRLQLICWSSPQDPPTTDADHSALSSVFETVEILRIEHDLPHFIQRMLRLPRYPSHVASRIPVLEDLKRIGARTRDFGPAAVVCDGIYAGFLARHLAALCQIPMILRGHNVEFRYFAQQASLAHDLRSKLAWNIARIGLERWERRLTRDAAWSFQISADDADFWRSQGMAHLSWAPSVFPAGTLATLRPPAERRYDVAYIGNMRLPNNLGGLTWFVRDVLPKLRTLRPGSTLCFAGANPTAEARALFAEAPDIDFFPDAPSVDDILSHGRVLVNPILSGSGVNVKSIDMLRYDAPIITTSIGVQGFPVEMRRQFVVRDDAAGFAAALAEAINRPLAPEARAEARNAFTHDGLIGQMDAFARIAGLAI